MWRRQRWDRRETLAVGFLEQCLRKLPLAGMCVVSEVETGWEKQHFKNYLHLSTYPKLVTPTIRKHTSLRLRTDTL